MKAALRDDKSLSLPGLRQARPAGVTLVELIAALSLVAILTAIAAPEFGHIRRAAARRAAVNDFMHAIFLARSKAIMMNGVVSLCPTRNRETCEEDGQWEAGWMAFQNADRDQPAERDAGEEILLSRAAWPGGQITSNRVAFSFRPTSQADVNGTLVFCDLQGEPSDARAIIISHTGRPRISKRDADNRALRCP